MNAVAAARGRRFRLLWLLLATASAAALTDGVLVRLSQGLECRLLACFCVAAWGALLPAWAWMRLVFPHVRTVKIVMFLLLEFSVVAWSRSTYFPSATSPEIRQYNILMAAVRANDLPAVERALRTDDTPDLVPESPQRAGFTCSCLNPALLGEAARTNDIPMMRLLIQHGTPINDNAGNSRALWMAVEYGKRDAAVFLLSQGANPNTYIRDSDFPAPRVLPMARNLGYSDIAQLLKHAGATD